jgi:hypothetical protein
LYVCGADVHEIKSYLAYLLWWDLLIPFRNGISPSTAAKAQIWESHKCLPQVNFFAGFEFLSQEERSNV